MMKEYIVNNNLLLHVTDGLVIVSTGTGEIQTKLLMYFMTSIPQWIDLW